MCDENDECVCRESVIRTMSVCVSSVLVVCVCVCVCVVKQVVNIGLHTLGFRFGWSKTYPFGSTAK